MIPPKAEHQIKAPMDLPGTSFFQKAGQREHSARRGFTLIELLVVLSIISVFTCVTAPALSGLTNSGNINNAVSGISLLLEQSRAYAVAHDTYVWVGFAEDSAQESLIIGVVAGKTGHESDLSSVSTYSPIVKLQTYNSFSLKSINGLPGMAANGDDIALSEIGTFEQARQGTSVNFTKVLQYSPTGEAKIKTTSNSHSIQISLQPLRGKQSNDRNIAVFQVASLTGQIQVFRP